MALSFLNEGGRSLNRLIGQRKLAQPAYDPFTARQLNPGDTVSAPNSLLSILEQKQGLPLSSSLVEGWAPRIGHITTTAATSKRRKTNPLLAAAPGVTGRKRNPFQVEQAPSADLFGLNIPT
jgi:hypothetical protein